MTYNEFLDLVGGPHPGFEFLLVLASTVFVILVGDKLPLDGIRHLDRRFHRFAARRTRAVLVIFLLCLFGRLALLPVLHVPEPRVHDEFSYLLAADTFSSGRLTNPTPFGWEHFETFHEIMRPTYMSMYQPGEGLILAGGAKLGSTWLGLLITTSALCAALTWALQVWFPPGWAFLGGLIAVIRIGLFSYWMNSYWGGSLAALGGVLLLGAFGRYLKSPKVWHGIVAGVGAVIMALTRPAEGLWLCVAVAVVSVIIMVGRGCTWPLATRVALPLITVVVIFCGFQAYYNFRITGSPLRLPYTVDVQEYSRAPRFIWQHPRDHGPYRHAVMSQFYNGWEFFNYKRRLGWYGIWDKLRNTYYFYFAHALLVPLLVGLFATRDRRTRPLMIVGAITFSLFFSEVWLMAHYSAVALAIFYAVALRGMRRLRCWPSRHHPKGILLVWAVPIICLCMLAVRIVDHGAGSAVVDPFWDSTIGGISRRPTIAELQALGGQHLVFVRYERTHNSHAEWVYNAADLEQAPIIWARAIDPVSDAALVAHYGNRHVWLFEPDQPDAHPQPYRP